MAKVVSKPYLHFVGRNSTEVTGSATLIRYLGYTILVDYGARQTSDDKEDYVINSKRNRAIRPKEIDMVVLTHIHLDHSGMIPRLVKEGMDCPIYIPVGSKGLLTLLWNDSVKIFNQDERAFGRQPIYSQEDVTEALKHVVELSSDIKHEVDECVSITYYNAQHVIRAKQVLIELNDGVNTKKVGFTGDWSMRSQNFYVKPLYPLPQVDVLVAEATYGDTKRRTKLKDRNKDIEKIITALDETKGDILIPTFSLDRMQNVLTLLYQIDKKHPIYKRILVDSPLGVAISREWWNAIDVNVPLWTDVFMWDKVTWLRDFSDTLYFRTINRDCLILAGGGFLQGGRARYWAKELMPDKDNTIMFCGYSSPDSIAGKIKSGEERIKIDGKTINNEAKTISLLSFSSHADYDDLLRYYTDVQYNKICLVHAQNDSKLKFARTLEKKLSKANRTSRVVTPEYNTKIFF